jgi:recombinational DNA repair protein RecR
METKKMNLKEQIIRGWKSYLIIEVTGTKIYKVGDTLSKYELSELKKYTKFRPEIIPLETFMCQVCEKIEVGCEAEICDTCARDEDVMVKAVDNYKAKIKNKKIIDEVESRVDEAIHQLAIIKKAITEENRTPVIGQGFVNMFKSATVNVQNHLAEASNGLNQVEVVALEKQWCSLCEEVEVFGEEDTCQTCQERFDDITKEDSDKLNELN